MYLMSANQDLKGFKGWMDKKMMLKGFGPGFKWI
jgi:hypothetical protein